MKKRFIITLTVALCTAFVLAWAMYAAISRGLINTQKDNQGKLNYIMLGKQAHNVLFMGSSRVFVQINPVQFDTIANTNSYNAGTDGIRVAEMEVLMQHYLKSHAAPGVVFLNIDETTLKNSDIWDYPRFFPYIGNDDVSALARFQKEMRLAKYLPPVALTYYDDPKKSLGLQGLVRQGEEAYKTTKGYNPLAVATAAVIEPAGKIKYYSDEEGIATFKRVLNLCRQYNATPVIVIPPMYKLQADTSAERLEYMTQLKAAAMAVPILDYSIDSTFFNKGLYRDATHLNEVGGALYTRKIAEDYLRLFTPTDTTAAP